MSELSSQIETAGNPHTIDVVLSALREVVDPEMSLGILDLGLVYGMAEHDGSILIRLTMTSAACPMAELIVRDIEERVHALLGADAMVTVELCWEPPWTPDRMSLRARAAMGWD